MGSQGGHSFKDTDQNASTTFPPSFQVQESPTITIPLGLEVDDESEL